MSERHETIEAREAVLRRELAAAHAIRDTTQAKLAKAKSLLDRDQAQFDDAQAALDRLKASRESFRQKATADHAFRLLAALHGEESGPTNEAIPEPQLPGRGDLDNAELKVAACQMNLDKLNADLAAAQDEHNRAASGAAQFAKATFQITIEHIEAQAIASQNESWRLLDTLRAACTVAGPGVTDALQQHAFRALDRFKATADKIGPMDDTMWRDWQIEQTGTHIPSWQSYLERLGSDASAQFERNSQ